MTPARHSLPSELTIYTVGETRTTCLNWLADPVDDVLGVDGSAVAEIDGAGVQLLAALARSLQARNRRLQLLAPSHPLESACAALGLEELLEGNAK